ncbi:acetolactate synthase large subunit [Variovorax sp. Sphag1AA]|uniref:acetolactate synthase large subunit n=1 Tax=Variovorax sp. Sphag1AA TaxID=2587027 RepID=UPI0016210D41|nr:acetolactate synthase large subunit [Variovorax sp. Sphag1AA]MBB3182002.1 acetolactate synthase-1/2/3 large subunit [Variovorax sp. Sphag1AA]
MSTASFGAQSVVDALVESGVTTFFANPGTSEIHLVSAIDRNPNARAVLCLFEGVATGAADGYARATGRPAAVLLHLGPGLANGLANLHNARKARSPMVVVVGEHASNHLAYDTPLKSDLDALAGYAAKAVFHMQPGDDLAAISRNAAALAVTAPCGPVIIVANADVMWSLPGGKPRGLAQPAHRNVDTPDLPPQQALDFLRGERSAVLLGGDALCAEGISLADSLAQATGSALLVETFNGRHERGEGIPHVDRLPYFREAALDKLASVDRLLLVGSRAPVAFFGSVEGSSVLTRPDAQLLATAETQSPLAMLRRMVALLSKIPAPRLEERKELEAPVGPLTPKAIWAVVNRLMPEGAIVSDESGVTSVGADEAMRGARRHAWLNLTGGSIGQGLPAGSGAAVGAPDAQVLVFHGDGGAMYTVQALWTQARERSKVVNVIFRNDRYAILDYEVKRHGLGVLGEKGASMFSLADPSLDWVSMAQAMGVKASSVATAEEFAAAFEEALATEGPVLIEARVGSGKRSR